ncbi:helix-turn-helix transcriptional regulator [Occultella glacieicola]|uniref:helix-turn-helix transcriptional regulator n=1 Tax=Occultella glacieicola TaxID=2518684 RepID=UPI0014049D4F|nr:WYL domain-containing protein [Occultella glacieicola]
MRESLDTMRADRLLHLLMLLQRHRRAKASWLAERLEVSERTILRDMDALSAAGVPVFTERGRGGGCVLMDGFTTSASGLTPPEAQALFAWTGREAADQLGLGSALSSALAKVAATAPSGAVEHAETLGGVVLADRRTWFSAAEAVPLLPQLREAVLGRRRVRMTYTSATETTPGVRTVDPIGIVDHSSRWYLVAEHRGRVRSYRVSRIGRAVVLSAPSTPVDDRPLAVIWEELRTRFSDQLRPVPVTLLVQPDRAALLRRLVDMQVASGSRIEVEPPSVPGGAQTWRVTVRQSEVMAAVAVLFAPEVTVLEPASMAAQIRAAARRALAHYPEPAGPDGGASVRGQPTGLRHQFRGP